MGYVQEIQLAEHSIGRSGRDLFLSQKDVTIIMAPYERHSVFPQAVDDLYRSVNTPFNLVIIEGGAPEEIRVQLEKRQRRHENMTIIYTNYCPALANAFNLALAHLKTPYALFLDNEIRLPTGTVEDLLAAAQTSHAAAIYPKGSMVPRQIIGNGNGAGMHTVETFGLRLCFLMSQEAIRGNGKLFDESSSPYTLGVDLLYTMRAKNLEIYEHQGAKIETRSLGSSRAMDLPLSRVQWNRDRFYQSLEILDKKWGIRLVEDPVYGPWLESKMSRMEVSKESEIGWAGAFWKRLQHGWKNSQESAVNWQPLGLSRNSCASKVQASRLT